VARGTVRRTIATAVVWLVIGADRIIRANSGAIESVAHDVNNSRSRSNETAQRALRSGGRRVNQDPAPIGCTPGGTRQS
jgi:hypothetical protein